MQMFEPINLPDTCYVEEVAYWIALSRLPAFFWDGDDEDGPHDARQSGERLLDIGGISDYDRGFSDAEFRFLGVEVDFKRYERALTEAYGRSSDEILAEAERFANPARVDHLTEDEAEEVRREFKKLHEQRIYDAGEMKWAEGVEDEFSPAVDKARSSVFQALSSGALRATGWHDFPISDEVKIKASEASELGTFLDIPKEAWTYRHFDWKNSELTTSEIVYRAVQVRTADMFRVFPAPDIDAVRVSALVYPGVVILSEDGSNVTQMSGSRTRGRPAKAGGDIKATIQRILRYRLMRGDVLDKQEALIEEFIGFVKSEFNMPIGRSTVQSYIDPLLQNAGNSRRKLSA
ncbi:hypothetical protein [Mesorhizobium onobrychidis]|uniref:Uncharacterized protein n=1 Tax=Mesorhizobium onobrychidis TaxID=2775404 RepID=A0ABY5QR74_9HYPH|nr:hypothetical protein [Mesorhizobium onobrychidis]UVC13523.1 hypothetical protein IHQ72_22760 [Mesorhizobium onobrychidis]